MDRLPEHAGCQPREIPRGRTSLKEPVRTAVVPGYTGETRAAGNGLQQSGLLVVVIGLLLLSLAAGDALAGAELGGRGGDALRGSELDDRLAGCGGEDGIWGRGGDDGLSGGGGADELYPTVLAATRCSAVPGMTSWRPRTASGTT